MYFRKKPDKRVLFTNTFFLLPGEYRVFGRTVHMNYLKEQLQLKGVTFDALRLQVPPQVSVEVQADTVYIQVYENPIEKFKTTTSKQKQQ